MSLSDLITHVDRLTKKNNAMKKFLQLAKDCKTDNEKIKFLDNFLNSEDIGEYEWSKFSNSNFEFLEENNLNNDDGFFSEYSEEADWVSSFKEDEVDLELKKNLLDRKYSFEEKRSSFKKIYPKGDELIIRYKLHQFSYWFDNKHYGAYQERITNNEEEILKDNKKIDQWNRDPDYEKKLTAKKEGKIFLKDTTVGGEVKTYRSN